MFFSPEPLCFLFLLLSSWQPDVKLSRQMEKHPLVFRCIKFYLSWHGQYLSLSLSLARLLTHSRPPEGFSLSLHDRSSLCAGTSPLALQHVNSRAHTPFMTVIRNLPCTIRMNVLPFFSSIWICWHFKSLLVFVNSLFLSSYSPLQVNTQ